jgi:hypothetical protein
VPLSASLVIEIAAPGSGHTRDGLGAICVLLGAIVFGPPFGYRCRSKRSGTPVVQRRLVLDLAHVVVDAQQTGLVRLPSWVDRRKGTRPRLRRESVAELAGQ